MVEEELALCDPEGERVELCCRDLKALPDGQLLFRLRGVVLDLLVELGGEGLDSLLRGEERKFVALELLLEAFRELAHGGCAMLTADRKQGDMTRDDGGLDCRQVRVENYSS